MRRPSLQSKQRPARARSAHDVRRQLQQVGYRYHRKQRRDDGFETRRIAVHYLPANCLRVMLGGPP